MKRRFGPILVLGLLILLLAVSVSAASGYSDVPSGHPFKAEIDQVSQAGIMSGMADGTFRPDAPALRQQMAKIMVLATEQHTAPVDNQGNPTFSDVTPSMGIPYPFDFVEESAEAGIFQGSQGRFYPYANITRVQLALIVVRAAGPALSEPPAGYSLGFTDVPSYAQAAVAKAKYNGILDGRSATVFDPWGKATRGHVAKMVSRMVMKMQPPAPTTTTTLPSTTTTTAPPTTTTTNPPAPSGNIAVVHLSSGAITNAQCIACHGDRALETSLDPTIASAHAIHLTAASLNFSGMARGCSTCHVSTDIVDGNGASIGKQVAPNFCLSCHGTFPMSKHGGKDWSSMAPQFCTSCHAVGSALDPSPAHAAAPYLKLTGLGECTDCHGGLALYGTEETN